MNPQPHRHKCTECGVVFLCYFGCTLDDDGQPTDDTAECDACIELQNDIDAEQGESESDAWRYGR